MSRFKHSITLLAALAVLLQLPGCLFTVTSIRMPASSSVGEEFCIAVDAQFIATKNGGAGMLMEVPASFEFSRAVLVASGGTFLLKRNTALEGIVPHDRNTQIVGLTGETDFPPVEQDSVRILTYFRAGEAGTFPVKFIFGIPGSKDRHSNWRTVVPPDVYRFEMINDTLNTGYQFFMNVQKPEVNGTAALSLSGERQFIVFPDSGLLAFTMEKDFSIEFWTLTTDVASVLLSTRADDYTSYFPFELSIDRRGNAVLTTADGRAISRTSNNVFISDGRWHHIALSYSTDSRFIRLIVDAAASDSVRIQSPAEDTPTPQPLVLGGRATRSTFYRGIVDEFRIWNITRGEEEVAFYQNAVLSGFEDNLYLLLNFEDSNQGILSNVNQGNAIDAIAYNYPKLVMSTAPLLAEVISFSAYLDDQDETSVILSWESFDDTEVEAYEVEKRTERGKFSVYDHVAPDSAGGNHQVYRLTDSYNGRNVSFYRLRRINRDGSIYYSEVYPIGAEDYFNFVLEDNKPDPFVAGTEITFILNEAAYVQLTVYDIMGKEVETLVSEKKRAGTYTVPFDGSEKPAGMYFYKLKTNAGSQTKKMYLSR